MTIWDLRESIEDRIKSYVDEMLKDDVDEKDVMNYRAKIAELKWVLNELSKSDT